MDQVNSLLLQELAPLINKHLELDGVLVTVTDVHCAGDLSEAKVFVSVLPERFTGTVLKKLRHISGSLAHDLRRRLKFKRMPVFVWVFDDRESRAAVLDEAFKELADETEQQQ